MRLTWRKKISWSLHFFGLPSVDCLSHIDYFMLYHAWSHMNSRQKERERDAPYTMKVFCSTSRLAGWLTDSPMAECDKNIWHKEFDKCGRRFRPSMCWLANIYCKIRKPRSATTTVVVVVARNHHHWKWKKPKKKWDVKLIFSSKISLHLVMAVVGSKAAWCVSLGYHKHSARLMLESLGM